MTARHCLFLVEEASMEAFLQAWLPRAVPKLSFEIHPFQGKPDLLEKLPQRLRAYSRWLPEDWRIVVLVDRDEDDCLALKSRLEAASHAAGLTTPASGPAWRVVHRIAIEELEAWYFGDWQAVKRAYPRASETVPQKKPYRFPDAVVGGTWEAFERLMKQAGYFDGGLRKIEAARRLGAELDGVTNSSPSFQCFRRTLEAATAASAST